MAMATASRRVGERPPSMNESCASKLLNPEYRSVPHVVIDAQCVVGSKSTRRTKLSLSKTRLPLHTWCVKSRLSK